MHGERLVERTGETRMPLRIGGDFTAYTYGNAMNGDTHIAFVKGEIAPRTRPRAGHSECLTAMSSVPCGATAASSCATLSGGSRRKGRDPPLHAPGGRGIGSRTRSALQLQDKGFDTVEANERLGFKPDLRDYGVGAQILVEPRGPQDPASNEQPEKIIGLSGYGLQ